VNTILAEIAVIINSVIIIMIFKRINAIHETIRTRDISERRCVGCGTREYDRIRNGQSWCKRCHPS